MSLFLPLQQKIEAHRTASTAISTGNPFHDIQMRRAAAVKTARSLGPKPVFKPLVNPGSLVRKADRLRHQLVPAPFQAALTCQSAIWPCDLQQSPSYPSAMQTKTAATAGAKAVIEATTLLTQIPASTGPQQHSGNSIDPAQTLLEMQEQGTVPLATQSKPKIAGGGIGGLILLGLVAGGFLLSKSSSTQKASLNGPAKSKAIQINL